jgi:hypothetical protein
MSGSHKPRLRVVGGNANLAPMRRADRETHWPRLRVVGAETGADASSFQEARKTPPHRSLSSVLAVVVQFLIVN